MPTAKKSSSAVKKSASGGKKRAQRTAVKARKSAAKSQLRMTRGKIRAAAASVERQKENPRLKEKIIGHAPHSSRVSAPKGELKSLASRTRFFPKTDEGRAWLIIDAQDKIVGRLATEIAKILRGKHKPTFTPNNDNGDFVVVLNVDKLKFTSNKAERKEYYRHTGYVGGMKIRTAEQLQKTYPERILEHAVKGMVPRNPLGRAQMKKLKIYSGEKHPHSAQKPVLLNL